MAVGREFLPPEDADSWGEFHARLEFELADQGSWLTPAWGVAAALLFVAALLSWGYAMQYHYPWLWLTGFGALSVLGVMAVRAVNRADQRAARAVELGLLEDAWQEHLARVSASNQGPARQ
jgi:hypothetical protein